MKCSACCTTRSKSVWHLLLAALVVAQCSVARARAQQAATPAPVAAIADLQTGTPSTQDFIRENTLQEDGKVPFHLKMSFQVFDMKGKPAEQGEIEYWWAGPEGFHLDISAPSFGTVHNMRIGEVQGGSARRSLYLANALLDNMRFPAASLGGTKNQVEAEERVIGSTVLECMHTLAPAGGNMSARTEVCSDPKSQTVRTITGQNYVITRNRIGTFAGTHVALDLEISWSGIVAIQGHVVSLSSFKPAEATVELEKPKTAEQTKSGPPSSVRLAGGVIAGSKVGGKKPQYPGTARQERKQGSVILIAEISSEGKIVDLVPIASPDSSLTKAATDAVSTWTYRPYLLNGIPVNVDTTITVNFNLAY